MENENRAWRPWHVNQPEVVVVEVPLHVTLSEDLANYLLKLVYDLQAELAIRSHSRYTYDERAKGHTTVEEEKQILEEFEAAISYAHSPLARKIAREEMNRPLSWSTSTA